MRNAALLELAAQLPAAFLADLLGISTRSAVRWTQAAGGEWAGYAGTRARNDRRGRSSAERDERPAGNAAGLSS